MTSAASQMDDPSSLGSRLKYVRGPKSQRSFADELGVAVGTYQNYERDDRLPDSALLARLIGMGWNANWLLTGEGPERLEAMPDKGYSPGQGESQDLSLETVKLAVQTVEEARQIVSLSLSPEKAGEVVSLVYQLLCSGLAEAEIIPITRQALNVAKGEGVNAGGSTAPAGSKAAGGNR